MSSEQTLLGLFKALSGTDQNTLLAFARFLAQADPVAPVPVKAQPVEVPKKLDIPRPDEERVVAAVKRLAKTYPMLSKNKMLGETSGLVTAHLMLGKEAAGVIDELEAVFLKEYQIFMTEDGKEE